MFPIWSLTSCSDVPLVGRYGAVGTINVVYRTDIFIYECRVQYGFRENILQIATLWRLQHCSLKVEANALL